LTLFWKLVTILVIKVVHKGRRGWLRRSGRSWRGGKSRRIWKSSGESRKHPFIEISPVRYQELLADWVEELPPFELSWIPHKDRFLHVWRQSTPLVLLHMHISK
jgi:hypothetical protein